MALQGKCTPLQPRVVFPDRLYPWGAQTPALGEGPTLAGWAPRHQVEQGSHPHGVTAVDGRCWKGVPLPPRPARRPASVVSLKINCFTLNFLLENSEFVTCLVSLAKGLDRVRIFPPPPPGVRVIARQSLGLGAPSPQVVEPGSRGAPRPSGSWQGTWNPAGALRSVYLHPLKFKVSP